ncbi:MAG TPA: hypothetical protein DCE31_05110 [Lautropia sp.]|nr:hypothetical protein [Lautropia sp.]
MPSAHARPRALSAIDRKSSYRLRPDLRVDRSLRALAAQKRFAQGFKAGCAVSPVGIGGVTG